MCWVGTESKCKRERNDCLANWCSDVLREAWGTVGGGGFGFGASSGLHCPVWLCSERDKECVSKDEVSTGLCWSCLLNLSQPDYCFDSYVSNVMSGYVKEHVSKSF